MLYALEVPPAGAIRRSAACTRSMTRCRPQLKSASPASRSSTTAPTTAAAMCAQGVTPTDDPRTSPGAVHPLVCTHPGDRPAHALSRSPPQRLSGGARSRASPRRCWTSCGASSIEPEFAWEHVWRVGDLVLWDNRCTMHRRDAFDPNSRRDHAPHPGQGRAATSVSEGYLLRCMSLLRADI